MYMSWPRKHRDSVNNEANVQQLYRIVRNHLLAMMLADYIPERSRCLETAASHRCWRPVFPNSCCPENRICLFLRNIVEFVS